MSEKMSGAIATALVQAQAAIRRVGHDAQNQHHRYKYTSAEALIESAREPMAKAGLALIEAGFALRTLEGSAEIDVTYIVAHASGESWTMPTHTMPVLPEKGRPMDKAVATARTYSLGYALRGLLKIPRTDTDDDVDQRQEDDHRQPPAYDPAEALTMIEDLATCNAVAIEACAERAGKVMRGAPPDLVARMREAFRAARGRVAAEGQER